MGGGDLDEAEENLFDSSPTSAYENFERRHAIISLLIILYHHPLREIFKLTNGQTIQDIRKMPSIWLTPKYKEPLDTESWLPDPLIFTEPSEQYQPALKLIANQIGCLINSDSSDESIYYRFRIKDNYNRFNANPDLLKTINYFLSHPSLLDSEYKLVLEIKAIIPIEKLKKIISLESEFQENNYDIDFIGKIFLVDSKDRMLDFDSVGAGYEQVCPILIALALGDTTLYKQPEVHLHPRLQSRLADCFIFSINELKKDFSIIETHSEHFVLRLLRRVRESFSDELLHTSLTLLPKDLGLIYFRPVGDKTFMKFVSLMMASFWMRGQKVFLMTETKIFGVP